MDLEATALVGRIARFVADPDADDFEALALAVFAFQRARIPAYRRLCERRGVGADAAVDDWRRVPAVPVLAFKSTALHAAPPRETFRSSGTTGGARSVHHHPYPDLCRRTIDVAFPAPCLPQGPDGAPLARVPVLALVPSRAQAPDSSLSFMADHVVARWGDAASRFAFGDAGVDVAAATAWARECAGGGPVLVFATAFALLQWLDATAGPTPLPPGSVVFETGGFKGRTREVTREELLARVADRLGVPARRVVREYGMSELTSQLYTRAQNGGDPDLFVAPHWLRARVVDPATLAEAPPGATGMIALFDLANVGSAAHLLTEDLGRLEPGGLRLLGRAGGAELRGCSLTVEELMAGAP